MKSDGSATGASHYYCGNGRTPFLLRSGNHTACSICPSLFSFFLCRAFFRNDFLIRGAQSSDHSCDALCHLHFRHYHFYFHLWDSFDRAVPGRGRHPDGFIYGCLWSSRCWIAFGLNCSRWKSDSHRSSCHRDQISDFSSLDYAKTGFCFGL